MIPVMRPLLPREEVVAPWLRRMDDARTYTNLGPLVRELESLHAARLRVDPDRVVTVANATLGLTGAVALTDVAEWHAPDFTFPATGHAVVQAGRKLILEDVHVETWELNTTGISAGGAVGIMPVLPFGAALDQRTWEHFEHVVVDAAASLGADDWDLSDLPETWAVVFSLHATKTLPAGEGGLVVFGSPDQARRFRAWSNFGFAGTRRSIMVGTNAKMSEMTAAYGLASLAAWDQERAEWAASLAQANAITKDLGLECPVQKHQGVHPYWVVQFQDEHQRDHAIDVLTEHDIETRLWWPVPLHEMPAFAEILGQVHSPVTSSLCSTTLGLPMFRGLASEQIDRVGAVLAQSLRG